MQQQWFETWFDSPFYHRLYCHRSDDEAQIFVQNICSELKLPIGAKVLDVACGKGRHSLALNKLGYEVTGVDLSASSIAHAKQFENERLHFFEHDMRLPLPEKNFDAVFNLFSSFGYFENTADNLLALQSMTAALKPFGLLVLDFLNSETVVKKLVPREIVPRDDIQFHIQRKLSNGFVVKQIDFLHEGETHHYEERVQLINFQQFRTWFLQCGLQVQQVYGDYELNDFQPTASPRLILVGCKC